MRFKVCCIRSVAEADMAIAAGAWAIGLVSTMPSGPGPIADAEIRAIAGATRGRVRRVLLTSRTDAGAVIGQIRFCGTDMVQLVDAVPARTRRAIREACPGVNIMQVVHVDGKAALATAKAAAKQSDMVLLDSGRLQGPVKQLGGTGRVHDWAISAQIARALDVPVILAGGLTPHNAGRAAALVKPFALDVCSGIRNEAFALDEEKLRAFARAAMQAPGSGTAPE